MTDLYRIKPFKTLAWWIACTFFVFPLSILAVIIVFLPSAMLIANVVPYQLLRDSHMNFWTGVIGMTVAGGIAGLCIGLLQRWLLRTRFYWAADNWHRWTAIGGIVGAGVASMIYRLWDAMTPGMLHPDITAFMMPLFLTGIALFQVVALRHAVKQSWLWIAASLVSGIVYAGIITRNDPSSYNPDSDLLMLIHGMFAIAAVGAITGTVMLFLFETKLHPMQPQEDSPLESDTPASGDTSVWDNVV